MSSSVAENAKRQLENRHIPQDMARVCHAIINHISKAPHAFSHLTFMDLYRISPPVSDDTFYQAVFLLTRQPYNILTQNFEALHPTGGYRVVPNKNDIIEDMKNNEFYNPFTGQELSESEFGEQVLTFFSPSDELMANNYA